MFCRSYFVLVYFTFSLAIMLFVLLRSTDSDYSSYIKFCFVFYYEQRGYNHVMTLSIGTEFGSSLKIPKCVIRDQVYILQMELENMNPTSYICKVKLPDLGSHILVSSMNCQTRYRWTRYHIQYV
jgi:hypothetical protein